MLFLLPAWKAFPLLSTWLAFQPVEFSSGVTVLQEALGSLPCSRGPLSVLIASRSRIPFFLLVSFPPQTLRTSFRNTAGAPTLCVESTDERVPAAFPLAG